MTTKKKKKPSAAQKAAHVKAAKVMAYAKRHGLSLAEAWEHERGGNAAHKPKKKATHKPKKKATHKPKKKAAQKKAPRKSATKRRAPSHKGHAPSGYRLPHGYAAVPRTRKNPRRRPTTNAGLPLIP